VANTQALTIVVVEHPSLAQVLKVAFDGYWRLGVTFDEAAAGRRTPSSGGAGGSGVAARLSAF
jgi:hypothetical protein